MAYVAHITLMSKPGAYARVSARYLRFAEEVLAHHKDLHDVLVVGDPAENRIEGYGIWESAAHSAALEDTKDFADLLADVEADLSEPIQRSSLHLLYHLRPRM